MLTFEIHQVIETRDVQLIIHREPHATHFDLK